VIEKCGAVFSETISLWGIRLMRYKVERDILISHN
jgi:hypothetical protein